MKGIVIVALLALAAVAIADEGPLQYDETKIPELFEKFVKDYNKEYKDDADRQEHYEIFEKTVKNINELNRKNYPLSSFSINQFADYNKEQQNNLYGLKVPSE